MTFKSPKDEKKVYIWWKGDQNKVVVEKELDLKGLEKFLTEEYKKPS